MSKRRCFDRKHFYKHLKHFPKLLLWMHCLYLYLLHFLDNYSEQNNLLSHWTDSLNSIRCRHQTPFGLACLFMSNPHSLWLNDCASFSAFEIVFQENGNCIQQQSHNKYGELHQTSDGHGHSKSSCIHHQQQRAQWTGYSDEPGGHMNYLLMQEVSHVRSQEA